MFFYDVKGPSSCLVSFQDQCKYGKAKKRLAAIPRNSVYHVIIAGCFFFANLYTWSYSEVSQKYNIGSRKPKLFVCQIFGKFSTFEFLKKFLCQKVPVILKSPLAVQSLQHLPVFSQVCKMILLFQNLWSLFPSISVFQYLVRQVTLPENDQKCCHLLTSNEPSFELRV